MSYGAAVGGPVLAVRSFIPWDSYAYVWRHGASSGAAVFDSMLGTSVHNARRKGKDHAGQRVDVDQALVD